MRPRSTQSATVIANLSLTVFFFLTSYPYITVFYNTFSYISKTFFGVLIVVFEGFFG